MRRPSKPPMMAIGWNPSRSGSGWRRTTFYSSALAGPPFKRASGSVGLSDSRFGPRDFAGAVRLDQSLSMTGSMQNQHKQHDRCA